MASAGPGSFSTVEGAEQAEQLSSPSFARGVHVVGVRGVRADGSPKKKRQPPKRTSKFGSRKGGQQGSDKPAAARRVRWRVRYEKLPVFDEPPKYPGELADRRSAMRWLFHALEKPAPGVGVEQPNWSGQNGTAAIIANRMGLKMDSHGKQIKRTLAAICDGKDIRERDDSHGKKKARKMTPCDIGVAADCLTASMGLRYAAAIVSGRRIRRMKRKLNRELDKAELKKAKVTLECVRQSCQRAGSHVHRRQSKKSGSADKTKSWAKASLAQARQQKVQILAGHGDRRARQECEREGWTPIALCQIAWWDERHRKVCLGCSSKYEWRFMVDKDHPECRILDPEDPRAALPPAMPRTTAKYLSEARRSLGVAMKDDGNGNLTGHRFEPYPYDSQLMIGLEKFQKKELAEIRRVATLVGGEWRKAPKANDLVIKVPGFFEHRRYSIRYIGMKVKDLPGGRYQALYPGPVRPGDPRIDGPGADLLAPREEWKWQVRNVLGRGNSPVVCVTDMMDHIMSEGDKFFKGTKYEKTWVIGHDHLSQWWSAASLDYLHSRGFDNSRYLCAQGSTNADNRYYKGSLVGCRPELMPLDSHLNADHETGMLHHVGLTSNLDKDDPKKFKMGTPTEVGDCMDRTWQVFPTAERIVQDILKFPRALDAIIKHEGAVVPELTRLSGRRKELHEPPHHRDCDEAVRIRDAKWDEEERLFEEQYPETEADSGDEDESESESEEDESEDE